MEETRILVCKICGDRFEFTPGQQEFFRDRGLAEPKRCPACRRRPKPTVMPDLEVDHG